MLDRVKADHATGDGLSDAGQHVLAAEHLQQSQHLDELAFAAGGHACFDQATQRREFLGQGPADQWCRLVESADLAFEQSQVMQRVEDKALAFIGARMTGDHRGSTGDHHLMDIAADYDFPVAIGGRYRVVGAAIAHQRLRADPGRLLFAGVIGCWRQVLEGRQIPRQALADCLVVTAQPIAEPAATTLEQLLVQRREARRPRYRHQQIPADPADQPFDLALVVPLTRTSEPVGKQVMRLQFAEHSRPLSRPIAQDAGHRQLRVVVEDRLRYAAEETERGVVPVTKRFGGLLRIGLHEAGVAVRQVDRKEVDLALDPGDLRLRLTKIRLHMARIVPQRYEHLTLPQPARQHLGYCPRIDPKLPRRFPSAQTLDLYGVPNPSIKLHYLHPPPSAVTQRATCCRNFTPAQPDRPAASMRDFCSGAYTGGRPVPG